MVTDISIYFIFYHSEYLLFNLLVLVDESSVVFVIWPVNVLVFISHFLIIVRGDKINRCQANQTQVQVGAAPDVTLSVSTMASLLLPARADE